jgi:hypothetical protein
LEASEARRVLMSGKMKVKTMQEKKKTGMKLVRMEEVHW